MSTFAPIAKNKHTVNAYADTSIFHGDLVYYVDATYGLLVYDYSKASDSTTDFGVSIAFASETIKKATLAFINKEGDDNFLYYYDSSSYFYKVNLT
jgi:hypothetical protein